MDLIYLFVFDWIMFDGTLALWRFSPSQLTGHQYHRYDGKLRYHLISEKGYRLTFISANRYAVNWLAPNGCSIVSRNDSSYLECYGVATHMIGVNLQSCTVCNSQVDASLLVRFSEIPSCFYWKTKETKDGLYIHLEVFITNFHLQTINDQRNIIEVAHLYQSRGESPTLCHNHHLHNVSSRFEPATGKWILSFLRQENTAILSPYVDICGTLNFQILGCSVSTATIFLKYFGVINQVFQQTKEIASHSNSSEVYLSGDEKIVGKIFFHSCFTERSILVTRDRLYYTVDDFETVVALRVSSAVKGHVVTEVMVGLRYIIILINGTAYAADITESLLFKKIVVSRDKEAINGIDNFPICLRHEFQGNQSLSLENGIIVAWSSKQLYFINSHQEIFGESLNWNSLHLPNEYGGSPIIKVKLAPHPSVLWVFIRIKVHAMLECTYRLSFLSCSDLPRHAISSALIGWEFLNSALTSAFMWSEKDIYYTYDQDEIKGSFAELSSAGIRRVIFDSGHSKWLFLSKKNHLYYGSGKPSKLLKLRPVDLTNTTDYTYKFREVDNTVIRVMWYAGVPVAEEYPLYQELYANLLLNNKSNLCDYGLISSNLNGSSANVVNLQSKDQYFVLSFIMTHPVSIHLVFDYKTNFIDLVALENSSEALSVYSFPGSPKMRKQVFRTTVKSTCTEDGPLCNSGIAVFEARIRTEDGSVMCIAPTSMILFINVTCDSEVHIRIRSNAFYDPRDNKSSYWGGITGCSFVTSSGQYPNVPVTKNKISVCYYALSYPYKFYPDIELYKLNKFVGVVTEDVKLVEINNRTGFQLQDINLYLKECYLCSQFANASEKTTLLLQIAEKVCPCKLDNFSPRRWIANISLLNLDQPESDSLQNVVTFLIKIRGNSFCDLTAYLSILVLPIEQVEISPWESKILWSFFFSTLVILIVSYWRYRQDILRIKEIRF